MLRRCTTTHDCRRCQEAQFTGGPYFFQTAEPRHKKHVQTRHHALQGLSIKQVRASHANKGTSSQQLENLLWEQGCRQPFPQRMEQQHHMERATECISQPASFIYIRGSLCLAIQYDSELQLIFSLNIFKSKSSTKQTKFHQTRVQRLPIYWLCDVVRSFLDAMRRCRTKSCSSVCPALVFSLAPDPSSKRGTSRCPVSDQPWSLLAPDPTRNRTTSRWPIVSCDEKTCFSRVCQALVLVGHRLLVGTGHHQKADNFKVRPLWAATKRGIAPVSARRWSLLAPDPPESGQLQGAHYDNSELPREEALLQCLSGLGLWSNVSSFSQHATMISWSCSLGGPKFRITNCTTRGGKVSSSLSWQVPSKSSSWNREMPHLETQWLFDHSLHSTLLA